LGRGAAAGAHENLVVAEAVDQTADRKGDLPARRRPQPGIGRGAVAAIGEHRPGRCAATAANIGGDQGQLEVAVVPVDRRNLRRVEIPCRTRVSNRAQAAKHADHAQFLDHLAQDKTRVFLHRSGGVLADVSVFGCKERLHHPQYDDQPKRQRDEHFDQAEPSLIMLHGVATGSTVARLVRTKLRVVPVAFAARESFQLMVMVYTR